ncbi:hypothetical protein CJP74_06980 [Psittacicella melopsittaci]|uniref:Major facilitator superfamily (MFS) profile domain-containing protein n=1 Tax=Psittacicella melopsittaci TaxID=2028576 RepID=A0A3A1Y2X5_9GAMM|nr:MFS transporter [Psittacicella melopsittaci]RIY31568.1 hypothetical protein CJP74_06980 [Psittacicella melopsittaci]
MSNKSPSEKTVGEAGSTYVGFDSVTPFQVELRKRIPKIPILLMILVFFSAFTGIANDAMVPGVEELMEDFKVDGNTVQQIVPYFVIGNGIGLFLWGPTIDRFGRRTIIVFCGLLAIALNFVATFVDTFSHLLAVRVVQGIVYAGMGAVPSVVLKDIFSPRDFVVYNSWLITLFLFTPALAPLMGGWIILHASWVWVFHAISALIVIAIILYIVRIPETLDPEKRQPLNTIRIIKNYGSILMTPSSLWILILSIFYMLVIIGPPSLLPVVAIKEYNIPGEYFGYISLPIVLCVMAGIQVNQFFLRRKASPIKLWLIGTTLQLISLIANLIVIFTHQNLFLILGCICLNCSFNGLQLGNTMAIYLMRYPHMTGTASSLLNGSRMLIGGLIVTAISHLPINGGKTLLISITISLAIAAVLSYSYNLIWSTNVKSKNLAVDLKPEQEQEPSK